MSKGNKGGRPTVVTKEVLSKLEEAFLLGCTDLEACFAAGIGETTLYRYIEANPEFRERKEALKQRPIYLARSVQVKALLADDINTAHKVIDRKEGAKIALTGPIQVVIQGKDAAI